MYPQPNRPEQLLRDAHERMRAAELEVKYARYAPSPRRRLAYLLHAVAAWLEPELDAPGHKARLDSQAELVADASC